MPHQGTFWCVWKFLHILLWINRMWPSWTTVHLAWQQTVFQHISMAIVMKRLCWMSLVVQEWCPKRYIHEITKQPNNKKINISGHSHFRIFKNQFQTLVRTGTPHNTTFLFLTCQYKNICLANSQPHICLLNRWMSRDSNILWVWMEVRTCWRSLGAAACTKN